MAKAEDKTPGPWTVMNPGRTTRKSRVRRITHGGMKVQWLLDDAGAVRQFGSASVAERAAAAANAA